MLIRLSGHNLKFVLVFSLKGLNSSLVRSIGLHQLIMVLLNQSISAQFVGLKNILKATEVLRLFCGQQLLLSFDIRSESFIFGNECLLFSENGLRGFFDLLTLLSQDLLQVTSLNLWVLEHFTIRLNILSHIFNDLRLFGKCHNLSLQVLDLKVLLGNSTSNQIFINSRLSCSWELLRRGWIFFFKISWLGRHESCITVSLTTNICCRRRSLHRCSKSHRGLGFVIHLYFIYIRCMQVLYFK